MIWLRTLPLLQTQVSLVLSPSNADADSHGAAQHPNAAARALAVAAFVRSLRLRRIAWAYCCLAFGWPAALAVLTSLGRPEAMVGVVGASPMVQERTVSSSGRTSTQRVESVQPCSVTCFQPCMREPRRAFPAKCNVTACLAHRVLRTLSLTCLTAASVCVCSGEGPHCSRRWVARPPESPPGLGQRHRCCRRAADEGPGGYSIERTLSAHAHQCGELPPSLRLSGWSTTMVVAEVH